MSVLPVNPDKYKEKKRYCGKISVRLCFRRLGWGATRRRICLRDCRNRGSRRVRNLGQSRIRRILLRRRDRAGLLRRVSV